VYWFIFLICMWNFLFLWRFLTEGGDNPWEQYTQFYHNFYPMILCFALIVPFFAWDAVRFSHRLVGPLTRFQRTLRDVAAGEPVQPVKLRVDDFLHEMKDDFNTMLKGLQQRGAVTLTEAIPATDINPQPSGDFKAISESA